MNTKVEQVGGNSAADIAKLVVALLILSAAIFAYYWYNDFQTWQRLLILLGGFAVSGAIAFFTRSGRAAKDFLGESLFELRKVVWPAPAEARKITGIVLLVVLAISLILFAFDFVIQWAIKLLLSN